MRVSSRYPRGAGSIALSVALLVVAYTGIAGATVKVYATVNCALKGACQTDQNSKGSGLIAKSTNPAPVDQYNDVGVQAFGNGGNAVYASSSGRNAGYFENNTTGFYSLFALSDISGGYPLGAQDLADGGTLYMDSHGNLTISGQLFSNGMKIRHQISPNEAVTSYAVEAASRTLEDVGSGRIVSGRGSVRIDPVFARTIDANYFVFVTPLGENHGLYVSAQNRGGFEVRESEGARSSLAFNYRIVGHPAGAAPERLPAAAPLLKFGGGRAP